MIKSLFGNRLVLLLGSLGLVFILCMDAGVFRVSAKPLHSTSLPKVTPAKEEGTLGKSWCHRLNSGSLRGAFREVSCLIYFRRSMKVLNHPLDRYILIQYAKLYQRVRTGTKDWRSISRWQALYILGTRMYPLQNNWGENADIPVYEVNGHQLALPFWIKEGLKQNVGTLVHFDTHSDTRMVGDISEVKSAIEDLKNNRDTKDAWHTIAHTVYDHGMPVTGAVMSGTYNRVLWAKPKWTMLPDFINHLFYFASKTKTRALSRSLDGVDFSRLQPGYYQLIYDPTQNLRRGGKKLAKVQGPWFLMGKKFRPMKKHFKYLTPFTFSAINMDRVVTAKPRSKSARGLLRALPKGRFTLDIDLDYFASIDTTRGFRRDQSSRPWKKFHVFRKQRKYLLQRLRHFRRLLRFLKVRKRIPAIITIADSTFITFAYDKIAEGQFAYTPMEHSAFLRKEVRKVLRQVYGKRVMGRGRKKRNRKVAADASLKLTAPAPLVPIK